MGKTPSEWIKLKKLIPTKKNIYPEKIYPSYDKPYKKPLPHLGGATSKTDFTKKIFQAIYILLRNSLFSLLKGRGGPYEPLHPTFKRLLLRLNHFPGGLAKCCFQRIVEDSRSIN